MSLLNIFFIISAIVILIFSFDIAKKQKFNALHFVVFFLIWVWLLVFTLFPNILNTVWRVFWLQRWADLLVYSSLIFLVYFVLLLLNKIEWTNKDLTSFIRSLAIYSSSKKYLSWDVVFLIRVYNEDKVLKQTIDNLFENWYENILVVNDWSIDDSQDILNLYWDKIILLNHLKNRWWWAALETWFEYLRKYAKEVKYVCTYDADWQHQVKDLKKFIVELEQDKELKVVLWSRFITKTNTNVWFVRKIVLKLGILFTFFISNIKLSDSHNWFRVFRTQILDEIKLTIDDMSYASEMIDIIATKNIKFKEVPVDIIYTDYSMWKWQKSSNAIHIAIKMIRAKFFR